MSVKADETAKRLMTIPGIGPVTASAIMAMIQDMGDFASGREFAAFLGLTPRQSSTGGKPRLGRITKMGDRYLRQEELSLQGEAGNRGRQRSDVNQRQRLGSPTRRRRHYERAGMMGAKSPADESSGPAEPSHPHQKIP